MNHKVVMLNCFDQDNILQYICEKIDENNSKTIPIILINTACKSE